LDEFGAREIGDELGALILEIDLLLGELVLESVARGLRDSVEGMLGFPIAELGLGKCKLLLGLLSSGIVRIHSLRHGGILLRLGFELPGLVAEALQGLSGLRDAAARLGNGGLGLLLVGDKVCAIFDEAGDGGGGGIGGAGVLQAIGGLQVDIAGGAVDDAKAAVLNVVFEDGPGIRVGAEKLGAAVGAEVGIAGVDLADPLLAIELGGGE